MTQPENTTRCVLALDLGTTTGWALRGQDGLITNGTASFKPGRYDGGGMRYLRFTNWLTELDRLSGPISSSKRYPGPPVPVPSGSPPWIMNSGMTRWKTVPS